MSEHLCKHASDEHVPEGRWIASLSNGETIYEDEHPHECSCWERLGSYCKTNSLIITQMRWQYKHMEHISKPNAQGYCLVKKIRSYGTQASNQYFCGIGYIHNEQAHIMFLSPAGHSHFNVRPVSTFKDPAQIIYNE